MTPLGVRVIGDQETLGYFARAFLAIVGRSVEVFENLDALAAGSSAHVERRVTRLHVEEKRRDHRNCLLTRDVAGVGFVHKEMLELLKGFNLAECRLWDGKLPRQLTRMPVRVINEGRNVQLGALQSDNRRQVARTIEVVSEESG